MLLEVIAPNAEAARRMLLKHHPGAQIDELIEVETAAPAAVALWWHGLRKCHNSQIPAWQKKHLESRRHAQPER